MRLLFVILLGGMIISINGCTELSKPLPGEPLPNELPEHELFHSTITFYQDERVVSVLQAGRIRKYSKRSVVLLDSGLVVDFFDQQGKHTTKLWADSGRVDESKKDLKAMGNVVAKSDSGQMLESQELKWDNKSRKIVSDVDVKMSTPTDTIYGLGFVSDEYLRNWKILKPTGTTFRDMQLKK